MPEDTGVIVAVRAEEAVGAVEGSVPVECDSCHHPVWISPATQRFQALQPQPYQVLCVDCAHREIDTLSNDVQFSILPETLAELRAYLDTHKP